MSEQENNKMEAWLKAYRQQRRDQWNEDPVELDEPTRAMLMAEVRRQNPATPDVVAEPAAPTFGWMRWALGGMTAAIVVLGISSLSKFQSGSDTIALGDPANGGSPETQESADAPADQLKRDANAKVGEVAEAEGGGPAGGFSPPGMAAKGSVPGSPGVTSTVQASPVTQPAPRPQMIRNTPERQKMNLAKGNYYNNAKEMQLNFAQQARAHSGGIGAARMAKQKDLPKPVLVNFELKRVGSTIRVMDGDGSVYTGTVINEETQPVEAEKREEPAIASSGIGGAGSVGPAQFAVGKAAVKMRRGNRAFFRVQGTNKTLKQLVILEATLDNTPAADGMAKRAGAPAAATAPLQPGGGAAGMKNGQGGEGRLPEVDRKNGDRGLGAIRAIARMRVLGNARIGKEDFPVDAYLATEATADKAPAKPAGVKKK